MKTIWPWLPTSWRKLGGGQIVVRQGEVIGQVALPIAGLMSNERAEVVARKAATVLDGFRACGCQLNNPNMQLSLLASGGHPRAANFRPGSGGCQPLQADLCARKLAGTI